MKQRILEYEWHSEAKPINKIFASDSVWNPHRQGLIKDLEKVQMGATKMVLTVKHLTYKDKLQQLNLPTLKRRRKRGDI